MLTADEHELLTELGQIYNKFMKIIKNDELNTAGIIQQDLQEVSLHIHALQNMLLAQSASREYPDKYRLLGKRVQK